MRRFTREQHANPVQVDDLEGLFELAPTGATRVLDREPGRRRHLGVGHVGESAHAHAALA